MTEDRFSEEFADFYTDNVDTYGDTDEGLEEAYNDFIQNNNLDEEAINDEIDAFSEFYSELEDVYGDTDEGIEEAYADFMELSKAENGDNYSEDESETESEEEQFSELEQNFMEFYSELEDVYGDTDEGIEEAYADFINAVSEAEDADNYSDEDSQFSAEDFYTDEELLEEFADFYSETEELYGDDVEAAFDDYSDALEAIANEDNTSNLEADSEDEFSDKNWKKARHIGLGALGGAALGLGASALNKWIDKRSIPKLKSDIKVLEKQIEEGESKGKGTFYSGAKLSHLKATLEAAKNRVRNPKTTTALTVGAGTLGGALGVAAADRYKNEDAYADGEPGKVKKAWSSVKGGVMGAVGKTKGATKAGFNKANSTTAGKAGMGAVAGLATGLAVGALTDKNSAERKALKAKVKAGQATEADKAKLAEMQKARRNRLLKSGAVGTVAGAGIAAGGPKVVSMAKNKFSKPKEVAASDVNETEDDKNFSEEVIEDRLISSTGKAPLTIKNERVSNYAELTLEGSTDRSFSQKDKLAPDAGKYVSRLIKGK